MNFADEFELPVTIELNGEKTQVKPLSLRDYAPWCSELQEETLKKNLAVIEESTAPEESKLQMRINAHAREITPDDCQSKVGTREGAERIIINAITKHLTGKSYDRFPKDEDVKEAWKKADAFIEELGWEQAKSLSIRLCGLFPRELQYHLLGIPAKKKFEEMMEAERKESETSQQSTTGQSPA